MKILVTNISLITFGGSEIDTLTVAKYFKALGHDLTVTCFKYGNPMKQCFEDEGLKVVALFDEELKDKNYDLVWAHHADILNYCIFTEKINAKKIVHHILSPYEYLESITPYYGNISYYICNSIETKRKIISEGVKEDKIEILSNSAPIGYFECYHEDKCLKSTPDRVAIISNHVPEEVLQFYNNYKDIVDIIGIEGTQQEVTPSLLDNYDLVITIGKTVQFCFAQGIPVYCYDRFGGPGYITEDNLSLASEYNFSGRGFNCVRTAQELEIDILSNYKKSLANLKFLKNYANQYYNYNKNMDAIMNKVNMSSEILLADIRSNYPYMERVNLAFVREYHKNYLHEINRFIVQGRVYFKRNGLLHPSFIEIKKMIENDRVNLEFDLQGYNQKDLEAIYFYPSYGHFLKGKIIDIKSNVELKWEHSNVAKITEEYDYFIGHDACYIFTGNLDKVTYVNINMKIELLDNAQFTLIVDQLFHEMRLKLAKEENNLKLQLDKNSKLIQNIAIQQEENKKINIELEQKKVEFMYLKREFNEFKEQKMIQQALKVQRIIKKIKN